jgi:DNA-binding response OmpR family regulator
MSKIVMVVEDNDDIREIIEILLSEEEYEVKLCPDAAAFRSEIAKSSPDLIIMDVMLPDGNGLDLCGEIQDNGKTAHIPILIMSAHASFSDVHMNCKPSGFIKKPFDIHNFIERVEETIGK